MSSMAARMHLPWTFQDQTYQPSEHLKLEICNVIKHCTQHCVVTFGLLHKVRAFRTMGERALFASKVISVCQNQ